VSELRKFVVPEILFGNGALGLAGRYARNPGVAAAGWTGKVEQCLKATQIPYTLFDTVTPNPKDHEVMAGAEVFRSEHCDAVVAVGGGSPIDCAKGIGIVVTNHRAIVEFEGVDEVEIPGPPLICVPTTAGTSADISQFAIIVNSAVRTKIAIISKSIIPDVALVDPDTTVTMSTALTASTGMDALSHAFEACVSTASSPLTDINAFEAARLIMTSLPQAVQDPHNMEARNRMMLASLMAGLAFSNASLGAVHAMAHALGGMLDAAHGDCNAVLLRHVTEYNFSAAPAKYCQLAQAMGIDTGGLVLEECKHHLLDRLVRLAGEVGAVTSLAELGLTRDQIPIMAARAKIDPCLATNPRLATLEDLEGLYVRAI
jgi:alcohol dehydrogenase